MHRLLKIYVRSFDRANKNRALDGMKKMGKKIAIVARLLADRSGGAERIACELANYLDEGGYEVTVLHFDKSNKPPFFPMSPNVQLINLYGHNTLTKKQRWGRLIKNLPFVPKNIREKAQWNFSHDFFMSQLRNYFLFNETEVAISFLPSANTPALLATEGLSVKVVATNHNVPEQDYLSPQRWDPNPLDRELRLKVLDRAAAIHVLSEEFSSWFPPHLANRIRVIPNYVSHQFTSGQDINVKKDNIIMAAGRLASVKNYIDLINAWKILAPEFPDWQVKLFGTGPLQNTLQRKILELDIEDTFSLQGQKNDLYEEYLHSSIFCHPAIHEGFGLVAAEAMALGTPVVFYGDCPGVNSFVKSAYNGLAADRNLGPGDLADKLRYLMRESEERKRLGANAQNSVQNFSVEKYKQTWFKLIDSLIRD